MDLYCRKCGEPWDFDCLHEETEARRDHTTREGWIRKDQPYEDTFRDVQREFRSQGCSALATAYGVQPDCAQGFKGSVDQMAMIAAVYEINGDDIDGAASDLEDLL